MVIRKGRMKYVPPRVLDELDRIKQNYNLKDARAFDKMAEFVPVGMEIEKAMQGTGFFNFNFKKRKKK